MAVIQEQPSMGIIRLGDTEGIPVVPQKHARLRRYLNYDDFTQILSKKYSENSYRLLCILVPAIDPKNPESVQAGTAIQEWEFDGFPTEEAWRRYHGGEPDAYDEDNDPCPTPDEIAIAFEIALRVNGAGRLGKIVTLVQSATKVIEVGETSGTVPSSMLPGTSGESPSTNSGTEVPISS